MSETADKQDRRVRRTRTLLRDALVQLILEKPYDQITVQDILDRADVSRSAFYAHFQAKDDLLLMGMPENILHYGQDESDALIPSVAGLFQHVQAGGEWLEAMSNNQAMIMLSKLARQRMVENWLERIEAAQDAGHEFHMPAPAIAHYLTGALMSLLMWWVGEGMCQSPAEMDEMFQRLAAQGLGVA